MYKEGENFLFLLVYAVHNVHIAHLRTNRCRERERERENMRAMNITGENSILRVKSVISIRLYSL